ncbi:hypothetical protein GQ43DRAFT_484192 [Delitschia confertaspora ATCC 74209]|uniref:Tetratricopeptide repeat protein n=1 Tax=Delitschia confertaspora ATCC 74209 TaxID=1513339 RepID=A0A9P4JDC7_9PLEO|nr:hypothetical protein GQ43DRAFT_484192 [Delitschia confertaspora ATCC 74209]
MADPFSIVAGAASLVDICIRLTNYLRDVHKAAGTIGDDTDSLIHEVHALNTISSSIHQAFSAHLAANPWNGPSEKEADLWKHVSQTLQDCQGVARRLEAIVKDIYGKTGPTVQSFRDAVVKAHRRRNKEGDLRQCRDQLTMYHSGLQILLGSISIHSTRGSQEENARSFSDLNKNLRGVDNRLSSQIAILQDSVDASRSYPRKEDETLSALKALRQSIDYAASTMKMGSYNKHFDTPQPVSSIFTGRDTTLQELKEKFINNQGIMGHNQQRRFVIYGIGGSGKTQFCSKFAEDNRESFWGVFWIDASSEERIKQTYSLIAKIGEVDPNVNAAMHWLTDLKERWLLIIDNADNEKIPLEKYFPRGNRGNILVTTRNPSNKVHGNVEPGFFEFQGLGFQEAKDLLLKSARQPTPWDIICETSASTITKTLGFLALAIVQAGAAIRDGLCSLKTYLEWYDRSWERLRETSNKLNKTIDETSHHMSVYTSWEVCYKGLEDKALKGSRAAQDAIQLLTTLSFFHWENVPFDTFRRAIQNPILEAEYSSQETEKEKANRKKEPQRLLKRVEYLNTMLITFFFKNRSPPALPRVIREARKSGKLGQYDDRIREAMKELVQMSLIMHNEQNDSYSMHPIVHRWARERPGLRLAEQAIWSEAAAMMLASSLLLPPLRNNASDEDYNRDVLPHVQHVRDCRDMVNHRMTLERQEHWKAWLAPKSTLNPERALMYAKFSLVYAHCGYWPHAEAVQSEVKEFLHRLLGPTNEKTRRITLALSVTYWNMGRGPEAERLQREVLDACVKSFGEGHVETLRVKDLVGQTLWQQGRLTEAMKFQVEAFHGLQRTLGQDHEDTLNAMDYLARTTARFWEKEHMMEAYTLHSRAVKGMEGIHGADHPRTLIAKEHVVRALIYLHGESAHAAEDMIQEVIEGRKRRLGKEHPFTLLAMANAAIVKLTLGKLDEAEDLLRAGLPIAERNLGEDHIGTLFGYQNLGSLRIRQGRYQEAEKILVDVTTRQKRMLSHRGDYHPDRLGAMIELAKCLRLQGRIAESVRVCDETLKGFGEISVREHPLARGVKGARKRMVEHLQRVAKGEDGDEGIMDVDSDGYRQFSVF